jgi:cell division transport system permease protein
VQYIAERPYVREYTFVDKEVAKKKYLDEGNDDWNGVLDQIRCPTASTSGCGKNTCKATRW